MGVIGTRVTAGLFLRPSGYHGLYCEEEYNECLSAPCLNAATCRDLVNGYECVCLAEYKGEHHPLGLLAPEWPKRPHAFLSLSAPASNWSITSFRVQTECWRWDNSWGRRDQFARLGFPPDRWKLLSPVLSFFLYPLCLLCWVRPEACDKKWDAAHCATRT